MSGVKPAGSRAITDRANSLALASIDCNIHLCHAVVEALGDPRGGVTVAIRTKASGDWSSQNAYSRATLTTRTAGVQAAIAAAPGRITQWSARIAKSTLWRNPKRRMRRRSKIAAHIF